MKAAKRDAKRLAALERDAGALLTKAERSALWVSCWQRFKKLRGIPRRNRREAAEQLYAQLLAVAEQQKLAASRKVQPVATPGLVTPHSRLVVTPDEARAQQRR